MAEQELRGPIKAARFIHRAILKEGQDFQDAATRLMVDDEQGVSLLNDRFAAFERILKTHEDPARQTVDEACVPVIQPSERVRRA